MTIITKGSLLVKKTDISATSSDEEKIEMHVPEWRPDKQGTTTLACLAVVAICMAVSGLACGVLLYRHYLSNVRHYRAFCAIPVDLRQHLEREMRGQDFGAEQVQWSRYPDVQLVSALDKEADDIALSALREELDITDNVESISVVDNGRTVTFIHSFNDNMTGIIDEDRCFAMELELEMVVSPAALEAGIEAGAQWDASPARSALRAVLPQLAGLPAALAAACRDRPAYMLRKDNTHVRKRSADERAHEYVQFAGNHLQQIAIDNMAEVLEYERKQLH